MLSVAALDALLVLSLAAFARVLIFGDGALHLVKVARSLHLSLLQLRLKPDDRLFGRLVPLFGLFVVGYIAESSSSASRTASSGT